jgi:hypothetical protein
MVYEKCEYYFNRKRYSYEVNGILWKIKERVCGISEHIHSHVQPQSDRLVLSKGLYWTMVREGHCLKENVRKLSECGFTM